jgi:hypothetical protein
MEDSDLTSEKRGGGEITDLLELVLFKASMTKELKLWSNPRVV